MRIYLIIIGAMSVLALILYGADKARARRRAWRIRESVLLLTAVFGGAFGALLGMMLFRHKTQKLKFWAVNLIALAAQAAVFLYLYFRRG